MLEVLAILEGRGGGQKKFLLFKRGGGGVLRGGGRNKFQFSHFVPPPLPVIINDQSLTCVLVMAVQTCIIYNMY